MSHCCKIGIIRCMDFRQNRQFNTWAKESELFDEGEIFDIISYAGSSQRFIRQFNNNDNNALLEIEVFANLHKGKKLVIIHHSNCGAYQKWHGDLSPEEEKNIQFADIQKAKELISEKFPSLEVVNIWAELKDSRGDKIEFSIID